MPERLKGRKAEIAASGRNCRAGQWPVASPIPGAPDDARALARLQLQKIDSRCAKALNNASLGDNTRAHLLESRARIRRALDATRSADVRSAGMTRE